MTTSRSGVSNPSTGSNNGDDEILNRVLQQWTESQRLENQYQSLETQLVATKSPHELIQPCYKRWTGSGFVLEKPRIKDISTEIVMCAGMASVLTGKVLDILTGSHPVRMDANHIFPNRASATAHVRHAQSARSPCAVYDLVQWTALRNKLIAFAEDKTDMIRRLDQEQIVLIELLTNKR